MKHVANRRKSVAKPRAKNLTQTKPIKETKSVAGKPVGKVVLKSRRQESAQKVEPASAKDALKLSAKTLSALKTVSARKTKPAAKQAIEPKTKKAAPKNLIKTPKTLARKTKQVSATKKAVVQKKSKKITAPQKINSRTAAQPKISVKPSIKKYVKTAKKPSSKVSSPTAKRRKPMTEITVAAKSSKKVERKKTPPTTTKKLNEKKSRRQL